MPITDPTDIANCELWLAAYNIVGASDGDPVSPWNDESGNARNATAPASGYRATYKTNILNGKPVLRFVQGGADPNYYDLPNFMSGFTAGEVFYVVKIANDPPAEQLRTGLSDMGVATDSLFPWTDGTIYDSWGTTVRKTTVNPTPSLASTFRIYNVWSATNDWASNLDGVSLYTTGTNTVGFTTTPKLGKAGGSNFYLDGDLAECVVFSRKLTTQERTDMLDYFNTEYFTTAGGGGTVAAANAERWYNQMISPGKY